jgi:hypothetical protein
MAGPTGRIATSASGAYPIAAVQTKSLSRLRYTANAIATCLPGQSSQMCPTVPVPSPSPTETRHATRTPTRASVNRISHAGTCPH